MTTPKLDRRLIALCQAAPRRARTTSQLAPLMDTVYHLRQAGHTWPTIVGAVRTSLDLPQLADSTVRAAYQCWLAGQSAEPAAPKPSRARRATAATAPGDPAGQTTANRPEPAAPTPHHSAGHPAEHQQLLAV